MFGLSSTMATVVMGILKMLVRSPQNVTSTGRFIRQKTRSTQRTGSESSQANGGTVFVLHRRYWCEILALLPQSTMLQ